MLRGRTDVDELQKIMKSPQHLLRRLDADGIERAVLVNYPSPDLMGFTHRVNEYVAQYAAAACCNELQTLANPASVGNVSTSAGIEDYNSMGATSANHLRISMDRALETVAIELLVMCEGLEYQRPLRSGAGVEDLHATVRRAVPRLECDRPPAPDIAVLARMIREGAFAAGVQLD